MHRLTVLYPNPVDPQHFREYYESKHLPLARQLPGLREMSYSLDAAVLAGETEYFAVWDGDFDSLDAMLAALDSTIGRQLVADVPNYATGGAQILHRTLTSERL